MKNAILIGATGLIGENLLTKLLLNESFKEILVISRKHLTLQHPKLKVIVTDLDNMNDYASEIVGDEVFCCLGSTIKKTPDLDLYRKIDYQYPLDLARIAVKNGATRYHLVSAMGANSKSKLFYSRTKGEVERDLQKLPFKTIYIYRPSLLDGDRTEKRTAESLMITVMRVLNPLLIGPLKKYRSIKIEKVTDAMLKNGITSELGIHIYESDEIVRI